MLVCIWIAHATSLLWLDGRTIVDYTRAWKMWNNPRHLDTSRDVTGVTWLSHPFSLFMFAAMRIGKLLTYYLVSTYLEPHIVPGLLTPIRRADFDPSRQSYFRRLLYTSDGPSITSRETLTRALMAIYWAWAPIRSLEIAHSALSIVFVVVFRLDEPEEWPPLFGRPGNAYSVRRFWSKFWHRVVVRPYASHAAFFSGRVLRLRPGGQADKILILFMIFFISGVAHAIVAFQLGDRCGWLRDLWWYCANFAVGALEAIVVRQLRVVARILGQEKHWKQFSEGIWGKIFGFVWVYAFFFWSVPKWKYPKLYCKI